MMTSNTIINFDCEFCHKEFIKYRHQCEVSYGGRWLIAYCPHCGRLCSAFVREIEKDDSLFER